MLKFFKEDWPALLIYFSAVNVLRSADIHFSDWQFWAILILFAVHYFWCKTSEYSRHFQAQVACFEECGYRKTLVDMTTINLSSSRVGSDHAE